MFNFRQVGRTSQTSKGEYCVIKVHFLGLCKKLSCGIWTLFLVWYNIRVYVFLQVNGQFPCPAEGCSFRAESVFTMKEHLCRHHTSAFCDAFFWKVNYSESYLLIVYSIAWMSSLFLWTFIVDIFSSLWIRCGDFKVQNSSYPSAHIPWLHSDSMQLRVVIELEYIFVIYLYIHKSVASLVIMRTHLHRHMLVWYDVHAFSCCFRCWNNALIVFCIFVPCRCSKLRMQFYWMWVCWLDSAKSEGASWHPSSPWYVVFAGAA